MFPLVSCLDTELFIIRFDVAPMALQSDLIAVPFTQARLEVTPFSFAY